MDWIQVITIFLANAGLIFWMRGESRNDWRHMDAKFDAHCKNVQAQIAAIQDEMKDFHGRLCQIEERYRGKQK